MMNCSPPVASRLNSRLILLAVALLVSTDSLGVEFPISTSKTHKTDVLVYRATPGGITAAIAAAREGAQVVLLEPTRHVGGMCTSGLNRDESEHVAHSGTFGGLANQFFEQAAKRSGSRRSRRPWVWHSNQAEQVFLEMLAARGVAVHYQQQLKAVDKQSGKLHSITTTSGQTYGAKVFIDASYEGDLMAAAKVSYATGRESRQTYGESLAGVIYSDEPVVVSPFDDRGMAVPGIMPGTPPPAGSASKHPTPYNVRLNLTKNPENQVPITKPPRYDSKQFELLLRCIEAGEFKSVGQIIGRYGMPGDKVELNNRQQAIVSLSMPGEQTPWAEATHQQREAIYRAYRDYTHGMLWLLKSDPRVPASMRQDMARYGFCADEWKDNDHWPWQLYVREARRMRGRYVLTESDVTEQREKEDVIHIASHFTDSHHTARYAVDESSFVNEGRLWQAGIAYQIPYRAITPVESECSNLLVPVCVSASHVAFCSIRVEVSWMMLGEAAGIAAAMACENNSSIQSVSVPDLQNRLRSLEIELDL